MLGTVNLASTIINPSIMSSRQPPLKKFWCFTWNNPDLGEDEFAAQILADWRTRYVVFQHETGEQGTPHYQGYAEFTGRKRFTAVRELLPTAHWEAKRGGRTEAREYCLKDDTRTPEHESVEVGDWVPSRADDLAASCLGVCAEMIKDGASLKRIASEHPEAYIRYHKGFRALKNAQRLVREIPPEVTLYYGPTGCDKTRTVMDNHQDTLWDQGITGGTWFDGYDNDEDALFDDFGGASSKWPLLAFLRVIDR